MILHHNTLRPCWFLPPNWASKVCARLREGLHLEGAEQEKLLDLAPFWELSTRESPIVANHAAPWDKYEEAPGDPKLEPSRRGRIRHRPRHLADYI